MGFKHDPLADDPGLGELVGTSDEQLRDAGLLDPKKSVRR
jgi:hypothetical protein